MQIEDSYPLSPVQHGMLIHSLSAPQSGVYVQQLVSVLREELNVPAFRQAWDLMVSRHAILRTSFVWDGADEPLQRVHANDSLPFECHDWRRFPVERREELLKCFLNSDRERGFRFDEAPLMRQTLFRYAVAEYRWIWTSHHALLDGRSRLLLLRELFGAYEEILGGRPTNLNGAQSYRKYIDWLNKNDFAVAEGFWRDLLSGFTAPTPLPAERNRPAENPSRTFGKQTLRLSGQVTRRLQSLAREHQLTPNTFFEGAWALLLSLYSGETDVVFGVTRAGRHAPVSSAESMVGLLIHTVPVRVSVPSEKLLLSWLRELRDQRIRMREFEHTPLVKIRQWSEVPAGKPLFESLLVFENYQLNSLMREQGADWEKRDFNLLGSTHYPLSMAGYLARDLVLEITYDHYRFEDAAIARMLGQVKVLLEGMVSDPARRLADLPRITQEERHQLLVEWNDTKRDYPKDKCIHHLFEAQVERTPGAIAVVFEDEPLTYRELNRRANQLAHHLKALKVGPEVPVSICMERSLEMVVGLLGILKAGGAYVPLDPAYPKESLAFMLNDTQAAVLLTQHRLLEVLPEHGAKVVCLDDKDWEVIARGTEENPASEATPEDLAYVIYTSGSTGKPKGVGIQHAGLVNLVTWHQRVYGVTPSDRATQLASPAFDAAGWELWPYLTAGGSIHIPDEETVAFPSKLLLWLAAEKITICFLPTPLAEAVLAEPWPNGLALRVLLTGGDKLHRRPEKALPFCLANNYGPTENTVVTTWVPDVAATENEVPPPIGRPVTNTQTYLLDSHLQPVPIGVPGELHIGGVGLARGYLNRPELTAERFIPNPFSSEPSARLYKTGDLVRYLLDGNIEFLGRIDHQVKIRGFRIELGEIEAALGRHPAVQQAVVLVRDNIRGEKELQAYIVVQQEAAPTIKELRSFLSSKLPDYMIPSAFVFLEALPLTPNGKVDRRALPVPDLSRPELDETFSAPRTPVEELLANIWTEVLKLEKVGLHDNFFELGGHSLLATQVISRVQESFQVELPLRRLFESPTVAGLAERIEEGHRQEQGLLGLSILPSSREEDLPLSFAQQRLWFLDQLEPNSSVYNVPSGLRLKGPLDVGALEQSLNEIVRRHETLRTTFSTVEGQPVQRISPSLSLSLPVIDLSCFPESEREDEARRLSNEEAQRPFDLERGPLVRSVLLHLGREDHVLLLTLHHIVSDGWSMGVLFRELSALYEAFSNGQPSPLKSLPVQYADFAQWQRQWLQGEVLETQLGYWTKRLENVQTLQLPTDRPRPAVQSYRGARQSMVLSRELTEALKTLSRQHGVTLFMTLLAAFQTLLYRYTGQDDILVGSPIAGRNRTEIESIIGFFVNTLVMRTDLSGDPSFRELLGRVRKVALEAYAHQDLPFEKLVEELQPERNFSHSPLFQVMFALQNAPMMTLRLAGLTVNPMKVDRETATFDLSLLMAEEADSLKGTIEYNTDLFDGATIGRMIGHFETLLEGIVSNPDQRLSDLPILTEAERQQLLVEWNDSKRDYPKDRCIHQLFEAQVERTPEAVAIVFGEEQLTYRELNTKANQLAHHLRKLGVVAETLVAICMERSIEMLVGLLGVLKAGGVYLPLDPAYPKERLAFMLRDSQAPLLLTQQRLLEELFEDRRSKPVLSRTEGTEDSDPRSSIPVLSEVEGLDPQLKVTCLDADCEFIALESKESPLRAATPDNLAYVIYTSGSTGNPKGVLITHYNVTRLLEATHSWFHFDQNDVWTLFHSYAFDFSVWEIWGSLLYGGRLVVVPYWVSRSPEMFYKLLSQEKVTVLNQTPSAFMQPIQVEKSSMNSHDLALRLVIFGGEALDFRSLKPWFDRHGDQSPQLVNMYGITETTVHVTYRPITTGNLSTSRGSLIGVPIPDLELYVLDQNQNPVPIGVPGELYVGGGGVGRGYLNRPELTAERFIPNPFRPGTGERLYRTGDLVRYLPNRDIEYLGRMDAQIKIRGFRIELGEVEAVLRQHPAVREVVVISREDEPTEKRLVAYVVPTEQAPTVSELNGFLRQKLPEYMVPSSFMFLDTLPLTPSGKLDRRNLPAPNESRPEQESPFVAPRTPVEELLAEIWAEVLKLERVGIYDNFFELGGHSLLITQVASRIQQAFQVQLPLRILFDAPTITELSAAVATAQLGQEGVAGVAQMLEELKQLSPDEVKALLEAESRLSVSEVEQ